VKSIRGYAVIEWGWLSPLYRIAVDLVTWPWPKRVPPDETVRLRQKWKVEIEQNLRWFDDHVGFGGAVIRDVRRVDSYPNVDDKSKGISAWFKVGLLGMYHRGLQVGLRIEGLKYEETHAGWRYCDHGAGETPDLNAKLVGLIPFERIVTIDWKGDEYDAIPHIYCQFSGKRNEPYEEIVFCEKRRLDEHVYYTEIAKYDQVRKLSKKLKKGNNV
jgi:hypothetical protein